MDAAVQQKERVMKPNVKPGHAEAQARQTSPAGLFSEWVQQGTEAFFATQRIFLDLVMRQNAMVMNAVRERLAAPRGTIAGTLTEYAADTFENFVLAQKTLLTLAKRENDIVLNGFKERLAPVPAAAAMADLMRRSVDMFIELQ